MRGSRRDGGCDECAAGSRRGVDRGEHEEHGELVASRLSFIAPAAVLFSAGVVLHYGYGVDAPAVTALFVASYLLAGWRVLGSAARALRRAAFDENVLMAVATLGAIAVREYPEAAGVMIFYSVGELLQDAAVERSRRSVRALLELKADHANLLRGREVVRVGPEELRVGDLILVRPGERVPVDGVVVEGSSSVDASALTGESVPRRVGPGDEILSGMVCLDGVLKVRVLKELSESTVSRIMELVERASAGKAKVERFITRFSRYYTPAVMALAALIASAPPLLLGEPFSGWVYRALVLLVISCPCALVLSIPLGYFAGIGRLAKEGVLVKGSNFVDALHEVQVVAFDKTGTLTKGVFRVTKVVPANGFSEEEVLRYAALAEAHSNHPVARAIREAYGGPEGLEVEGYEELAGLGVRARVGGREVVAGNDRLLHLLGVEHRTCDAPGTAVHVAVDGAYAGYIVVSDEVKEDAREAIAQLKRLGVKRVVMLTGDSADAARRVAEELGLDGFYAGLLPEDKVRVVEELGRRWRGRVAFVGDGINDAPVIARADVGVAMGALGSDAAVEAADVVVMDDRPSKVPLAVRIARMTRARVRENVVLSISVKLAFVCLGAAGAATMWQAVLADVGVALAAVLNAMRVLR